MKSKLLAIGVWIKDHFMLAVLAAIAMVTFFFVPHFREFAYGLLRVIIGVIAVSIILYVWFKDTIRQYLISGGFVAGFNALEEKHKVAVTLTVIIAILWAVVQCLVHA